MKTKKGLTASRLNTVNDNMVILVRLIELQF